MQQDAVFDDPGGDQVIAIVLMDERGQRGLRETLPVRAEGARLEPEAACSQHQIARRELLATFGEVVPQRVGVDGNTMEAPDDGKRSQSCVFKRRARVRCCVLYHDYPLLPSDLLMPDQYVRSSGRCVNIFFAEGERN